MWLSSFPNSISWRDYYYFIYLASHLHGYMDHFYIFGNYIKCCSEPRSADFFSDLCFRPLGYIFQAVELLGHMESVSLRNMHIIFPKVWTSQHSYQQWMRVPFPPHPQHQWLLLIILMCASLCVVRWYLIIVLSFIPLMINNIEHFSYAFWPKK